MSRVSKLIAVSIAAVCLGGRVDAQGNSLDAREVLRRIDDPGAAARSERRRDTVRRR